MKPTIEDFSKEDLYRLFSLMKNLSEQQQTALEEFRTDPETKAIFSGLLKQVLIPCRDEVCEYFYWHPGIVEPVCFACGLARKQLGPNVELSLEVYHDPEIEDEHLVLYVRQESYSLADNIMERINQIEDECADRLVGTSREFLITTDFRVPQEAQGEREAEQPDLCSAKCNT